jgi:hypothetical protein
MSKRKAQRKVVTQKEKPKDHLPRRRYSLELLIILSLVISTLAAFGQVRNHEFLNCIHNGKPTYTVWIDSQRCSVGFHDHACGPLASIDMGYPTCSTVNSMA